MKSETKETQRREDDETRTGSKDRTGSSGKDFRRQGSPTKFNSKENGSPTAPRDWHGSKNGCGAACNDYRSHVLHRKVTAFADS